MDESPRYSLDHKNPVKNVRFGIRRINGKIEWVVDIPGTRVSAVGSTPGVACAALHHLLEDGAILTMVVDNTQGIGVGGVSEDPPGLREAQEEFKAGLGQPYEGGVLKTEEEQDLPGGQTKRD